MISNLLTPRQLWSNYDPYKEPLRPSYLDITESQSYYHFKTYINGDSYDNEPIRIYVQCYIPKKSTFNSNIILMTDVGLHVEDDKQQENLANLGFGVFSFDYSGFTNSSSKFTHYPKSINYANYEYSNKDIFHDSVSPQNTPIFIWCKVCRKVINLIKQTRGDDSQIILTGYKLGADIAWQVAAIDKRVDAVAAFLNAGWQEFRNIPKLSNSALLPDKDDVSESWLSASSTQAYIKFVNCPALILAASNSPITSLDRIVDSANLIKSNGANICLNISAGQSNSMTKEAQILYLKWIDSLSKNTALPKLPKITISIYEHSLMANLDVDKSQEIEKISVHYSYDELDSTLRSWSNRLVPLAGLKTDIPVYKETKIIFAFASVKYKNGFELTSLPTFYEIPQDANIERTEIKKSRIIYQKSFGPNGWIVEQSSVYVDIVEPKIVQGPFGVYGITTQIGNLSTYTIGEYKFKCENQNLLQFDVCSSKSRELTVEITSGSNGVYNLFYSTITIPENVWTKCSLKVSDFKTKDLVPLKEWGNIKKLTFLNVDNALFNNIIWI